MEAEGVWRARARRGAEHTPFFCCLLACHDNKRHFISIKTYSDFFLKKYLTVGVSRLCSCFVPQQCTIPNDKKNRTEQKSLIQKVSWSWNNSRPQNVYCRGRRKEKKTHETPAAARSRTPRRAVTVRGAGWGRATSRGRRAVWSLSQNRARGDQLMLSILNARDTTGHHAVRTGCLKKNAYSQLSILTGKMTSQFRKLRVCFLCGS